MVPSRATGRGAQRPRAAVFVRLQHLSCCPCCCCSLLLTSSANSNWLVMRLRAPVACCAAFPFVAQVAEGVFEGVSYPAMHCIWGQWCPPLERSLLTTVW